MNPYQNLVAEFHRLATEGKSYPLGGFPNLSRPEIPANAPKALIFSPHPDDECVIGALALRLLREGRMNVINVAVTQGSNPARRTERFKELADACQFIGFGLIATAPNGLENITFKAREQDPARWKECVAAIVPSLRENRPAVIFLPHERDWNGTHIGTHFLVMDALRQMPADFQCHVVETEFWGAMDDPNLMVEISAGDLADQITALSFHVGEVKRNPYHLILPAWMQDNVRRGSELVGGQGGAAPDFVFATLYRLRLWQHGQLTRTYAGGRNLPAATSAATLFL